MRRACTALAIVLCGCASGAPEDPGRQLTIPITDFGSEPDAHAMHGAAGGAVLAAWREASLPDTGQAGGGAMPTAEAEGHPRPATDTGTDTELEPEATPATDLDPVPATDPDPGTDPEPQTDPGAAGGGAQPGPSATPPAAVADCFHARQLWSDGFESGDYRNWSSQTYGASWGDGCQNNAITTQTAVGGTHAQRSEITCPYTAGTVHRGYGGLQFAGDNLVPAFTNAGTGIDAPNGLVNTTWIRLDSDTVFENGKWVNFFTVNADCTWTDTTDEVLTLGIEDASGRLAAAHYQAGAGGTRTFEPNAPALPRGQWVRVTTYVNYHTGVMHVWQNGRSHQHVTFSRPLHTICHWHWGLYASSDNDDIVLFEDDNSIWKLAEPWTDFSVEPYFGEDTAVCN